VFTFVLLRGLIFFNHKGHKVHTKEHKGKERK
jgi:hypothetical protein